MSKAVAKPILLLILDGWGHREEVEDNAIAQGDCPNWRKLLADCPHTLIDTHGLKVGLPDDQMGNSEVGHMNLGAGRIVYQDLTRIDEAIRDGSLANNAALQQAFSAVKIKQSCLHLMGLVSPGGVHSHEAHLFAVMRYAKQQGVEKIAVHAFLDGRDVPPRSAESSLKKLQSVSDEVGAKIATVTGRYFAMDRDNRWDRVEQAYLAITDAKAQHQANSAADALIQAYARDENDEFVAATVIDRGVAMQPDDAMIFINFRADRAREISQAFVLEEFTGFKRPRALQLSAFVSMTQYSADLPVSAIAFAAQSMQNTLPEILADKNLKQLRIAETEKYAHVTFFFNGGREQPFIGEERILIPSPQVATYDLQPEMSLPELTEKLCAAISSKKFDVIVCNIANPDMVGHSGIFAAALKAVKAVDIAIGKIRAAIETAGGEMLLTADHGNLEMMRDPATNQAHTAHTIGPVPLVFLGRKTLLNSGGALRDIAPTILELLNLPAPIEMTGKSLLAKR